MNLKLDANRILVFAPHPDDDILGCGGSIAAHVEKGDTVKIVYLTPGESGSLDIDKAELGDMRKSEAQAAARVLGVEEIEFLGWPNSYLNVQREYVQQLTSPVRRESPHRVYLPHS